MRGAMSDTPKDILEHNIQELNEQLYTAYKRITKLNKRIESLANFNPDWDMLEATQSSLREHMVQLNSTIAENKRLVEGLEHIARHFGSAEQCRELAQDILSNDHD